MSEFSTSPAPSAVRVPADYYAAPTSEVRPFFPRWVPYGCGSASALFIVLLFVGGAWIQRGGLESAVSFFMGMMETEMTPMFGKDVSGAEKQAFSASMKAFSENLRTDRVPLTRVQPVMDAIQLAIADKAVTREELVRITDAIDKANVPQPPKPNRRSPS